MKDKLMQFGVAVRDNAGYVVRTHPYVSVALFAAGFIMGAVIF